MENKDRYLIIYHSEDNDGVFSAAIFIDYLKYKLKIPENDICSAGVDYNQLNSYTEQQLKDLKNKYENLIMLDISFNDWKKMRCLQNVFNKSFIWIDHHEPIIRESYTYKFDDLNGYRNINCSTIVNVYNYLYLYLNTMLTGDNLQTQASIPTFYNYLSLWDSWTYKPEDKDMIYNFNTGVTYKYKLDLNEILKLVENIRLNPGIQINLIKELINSGGIINNAFAIKNEFVLNSCGDGEWTVGPNNKPAMALFIQGSSNSLMFESIKNIWECGIVFKYNKNNTWSISLYNTNSDDKFHCGHYLKSSYKGGGHAGAAGACVSKKQFDKILKNKHI